MNNDGTSSSFPSASVYDLASLVRSLEGQLRQSQEQLQQTQEKLAKALEKIDLLEKELAKLRKTPKKPTFRPNPDKRDRSGNKSKNGNSEGNQSSGNIASRTAQREKSEVKVQVSNLPEGSRFKGYQPFTVQELAITAKEVTYLLEVWQIPTGEILRAKLPGELQNKHFGPELRALAASLYASGMTQPGIHQFFQDVGIEISSGQVSNCLLDEADGYSAESEEILRAGLEEAPYIRTDDTGEKHKHKAAYCTHIGGEFFAYFKTGYSKSRKNFLGILLQGKEGYHINDAMIWHLFQSGVDDAILNFFEKYKGKKYNSKKGMNRLLNNWAIDGKKLRKQCLEAALIGFISATILRKNQVLLSDRAGQFAVFNHSGCWVHMERPLRKIPASSEQVEMEIKAVRNAIWTIYRKITVGIFENTGKEEVNKLYDTLITMKSISPEVTAVIDNFKVYRDEMLKALDHPGLPLHNNDSERDIRGVAKRRNISGSTKSETGRKFRDGLLSLKQTCYRAGCNFWNYMKAWARGSPPKLADIVRSQYQAKTAAIPLPA